MPHFVSPIAVMNLSHRPRILWGGFDSFEHSASQPFMLGNVWCIHYYEYAAKMEYNDSDLPISSCQIGICEPYTKIRYHGLESDDNGHYCFNFQLQDVTDQDRWGIPLAIPRSMRAFSGLRERIVRATSLYKKAPMDAEVELWSILLTLATRQASSGLEEVDTVDQRRIRDACSIIEVNLTRPIYAQRIANNLGISVSHLGRLFRKYLDCPVATYIRRRRVQRAHELLCFSEMPIQDVATFVGVSDLANFNRMMKREFSLSPRQLRERKSGMRVSGLT